MDQSLLATPAKHDPEIIEGLFQYTLLRRAKLRQVRQLSCVSYLDTAKEFRLSVSDECSDTSRNGEANGAGGNRARTGKPSTAVLSPRDLLS